MFTRRILGALASASLIFFSGCKIETPPVTITVTGTDGTTNSTVSQLSCAASVSSAVSQVISGDTFPVTIQVTGGTGPFTYSQYVANLVNQIMFTDTFTNSGSSPAQVTHSYTISDAQGNSAACNVTLTVNPTPQTSNLACAFSANTTSPAVGQTVNYTVTVSGGTAPYSSSNYQPGSNTTYASTLVQSSATTFSSSAIYGTAGYKTASVQINDALGGQTTCSQVINVIGTPSVSVTASPSSTVAAGTPITLTATTANFSSNPDVTFSTLSGGVALSSVGNTIVVSTTDFLARTVVVDVVASNGSQQASTSITLNFTGSQSLTCYLEYPPSYTNYKVGDQITFSVRAASGEALALTSLSAQDGTVLDPLGGSSANIRFNSSGTKTVYATARSASTGVLCNSGAYLTNSLYIAPQQAALSCTAVTSPDPTYRGGFFLARAVVPSGSGVGTVRLVQIQTSWDARTSYSYYNDATSSYMAIYNAGTFPIVLTVRDSAGNTATCSTYQTVY